MRALTANGRSVRWIPNRGRVAMALVLVASSGWGVAACSDGGADAQTATTSPEDRIVSDAEVTEGLADVRAMATEILGQLGSDPPAAEQTAKAMYQRWFEFEGTVRKNDIDLYLQMEDGLSGIKAGIEKQAADRVQRGKNDLDEGADAYLAAHG